MGRWRIIGVLVVATALLAGCSLLRLAYDQAPQLVVWRLQRDLQLDDAQTRMARELVQDWFAWHRSSELPGYVRWLERATPDLADELDPTQLCRWWDDGREALDRALQAAAPRLARLAMTLTPAQIDRLAQRQQAQLADLRETYLEGEVEADRLERTLARAQRLYGRLDSAQRGQVRALLARTTWDPQGWLARRQARQDALIGTLRTLPGATPAQAQQAMSAALRAFTQPAPPRAVATTSGWHQGKGALARSPGALLVSGAGASDPRVALASNPLAAACGLAADIHHLTTPTQRRQAIATIEAWTQDLRRLALP